MLVRPDDLTYRHPRRAGIPLPGPLGLAVGFAASIAATMISWAFGAGDDPRVGMVLLTLTAIVVGAMTTMSGAIGAGVPAENGWSELFPFCCESPARGHPSLTST